MGTLLDRPELELSQSLRGEYQLDSHPHLLHRASNQLCSLHKLTTNSAPQAERIAQVVNEYKRTHCASISQLQGHYCLEEGAYCSEEQTHYLIFRGQNTYTLRQEVAKRRFHQQPFQEQEIQQVVETYLCGLRQYVQRFQRDYSPLTLDSLLLDLNTNRIVLRDPWLGEQPETEKTDNITRLMQSYPSPEKLASLASPKMEALNEFLSNLFSVGAIALELKRLEFADGIYSKRKEVQYDQIGKRLSQFKDGKLRRGVEMLLDREPIQRKQVYSIWGIESQEQHFLKPLAETSVKNSGIVSDLAETRKRAESKASVNNQNETSRGQTSQIYIPPLQFGQIGQRQNSPSIQFSTARNTSETNRAAQGQNQNNQYLHLSRTDRPQPTNSVHFAVRPAPPVQTLQPVQFTQPVKITQQPAQIAQPVLLSTNSQNRTIGNRPVVRQREHVSAEKGNGYMSFKDYLNKEDTPNPQISQNFTPIIGNLPNNFGNQNSRDISPTKQTYKPPIAISPQPANTKPSAPFTFTPNNSQPYPQQNTTNFGPIKESFTYFETSANNLPQDQLRRDSQQTHIESQIAEKDIRLSPIAEAKGLSRTQLKEITYPKQESQHSSPQNKTPNLEKAVSEEIRNDLSPTKFKPNASSELDTFVIRKAETQKNPDTPNRPTAKHKYNSTIVEVRDQDTPDHSAKSDDPIEEEYVVEEYETGSRYQGFKSAGMRNGRGRFYYQDGGYYEGQWKNNKMDGFGKLYYEGGKLAYEGQWSKDEFNGLGKVYNDNPIAFNGSFDYTNFDYLEDYWEYYEGMLVKDTKEGRGRIKLSNGETFEGDFHEDKIQGFGKFHALDGKIVQGIWRESKLIKVINIS